MTSLQSALSTLALLLAASALTTSARADGALNRQCDLLASSKVDIDRLPGVTGIERDEVDAATAIPACEAAMKADPENAHIAFNLARALEVSGTDQTRATELYRQAAENGSLVAMVNLGSAYQTGRGIVADPVTGFQWRLRAAEKGLALAQRAVGNVYRDGDPVAQDYAKAVQWYQKADAQGDIYSTTELGFMTEIGRGVDKDPAKAAALYQKAADAGDTLAMNNLGHLYETGLGVPQDYVKARKLFEAAAAGGETIALNGLGYLYDNGFAGQPIDHVKANDYYRQAADAGNTQGMANLGDSLIQGSGIKQDIPAGLALWEQAEAAGNYDAAHLLAKFYSDGKFAGPDLPKAADHYLSSLQYGSNKVYDLLITNRAEALPPELVTQLQVALLARGRSFTANTGTLSESAIDALKDLARGE